MPQVLKPVVRQRIVDAATTCFQRAGYSESSIAAIAGLAGVAPASIYRYAPSKEALFDLVVPTELEAGHDEVIDRSVRTLAADSRRGIESSAAALLDFWIEHRRQLAILLSGDAPAARAGYRDELIRTLVTRFEATIEGPVSEAETIVFGHVFDNTIVTVAKLLGSGHDDQQVRRMVVSFWAYHVPGLRALRRRAAA